MCLMVIIENTIKLVTSVKGVVFSPCYTYPPKCLCTTILNENWEYHKIIKTKYQIDLKFKTVNCKWKTRSQLIHAMCLMFPSGRTEITHTKTKNAWKKK